MKRHALIFLILGVGPSTTPQLALGEEISWPPELPGGKPSVTISGEGLLKPVGELREGVTIAKTPPEVEFFYYDCQTYEGKPWSVWGDGLVAGNHYYSSVGDHRSPVGNAFVYDYDMEKKTLVKLADVASTLKQPEGWYVPGKIHSRLGLGKDGWLYFTTHRGSTKVAEDPANHFEGDWILRVDPRNGGAEVVARAPLETQSLPTGMLDAERMFWYAGTADGLNKEGPQFLAYDVAGQKTVYTDARGPYRAMILSSSTGMLYFHAEEKSEEEREKEPKGANLFRFDPRNPGKPKRIDAVVGLRASSGETPDGLVYTVDGDNLWAFDVKSEAARHLGPTAVAASTYTTSLDADPSGRFLYYIPGAHGGAERDGTPVVQFDTRTKRRKILCFLHPALQKETGYIPIGTFGSALSEDGGKLFVTWNGAHDMNEDQDRVPFRSVAMTVISIPASERRAE